jgi:DNA polymerase-3 subunit beta
MKVQVQKQILETLLINLQPFLEKKDASQITSHIFFSAQEDENKCIIKATDSEIGLQIITDQIEIEHPGDFTVNGKKFLDVIRILKDDIIVLELLNNILSIKQQHSKFKLPIYNAEDYPNFPTTDEKSNIELDSLNLIRNLKKISPAIDNGNPKFELNGALINIRNNGTDLVGTDTRRLAVATIKSESDTELSLILPKKAILEIQKLFLNQIEIFYDNTTLIIQSDNYLFYTRLINGKFPDYQRIIPTTLKHEFLLPKKAMLDSIRMITTISQDIKIEFKNDTIQFNSFSTDNVEAKTEIELQTGLNDFAILINSKHMLDFLSQVDHDTFTIGLNETTLPFLVKDENFMTIIMPIVN